MVDLSSVQVGTNRGTKIKDIENKIPSPDSSAESSSSDEVSVSKKAEQFLRLEQTVSSTIAKSSDVDLSKVKALQEQIAQGKYAVNPEKLADKMMEKI